MSIQKTIIHECTGYYKGYEHLFECIDDNRMVDINTTGDIVCKIKKRLDFYSNSTNENIKKYLSCWNRWLVIIVPDGINPHIDKGQFYVKRNYELLEDNNSLTHNKALFLLLGLNAFEIGKTIKNFPELNCEQEPFHFSELELWRTKQNQALLTSSFFEADGKITSENLVKIADKNNFFTKLKTTNQKTAGKDENIEVVRVALLDFLEQFKRTKKLNKNELSTNKKFIEKLKEKGLIIKETELDANKPKRKSNEIAPRTLSEKYLTPLFISKWWIEQDKSTRNKVRNYQKIK